MSMSSYNDNEDLEDDYEEPKADRYSFEIRENFDDLRKKLSRSMKNGLIHELAKDDVKYDRIRVTDKAIVTYSQEEYSRCDKFGICKIGECLKVDDERICLEYFELYSLCEDRYGNSVEDVHNCYTIKAKEGGGCVVTSSIKWEGLEKYRGIFAGVRNEITYVPKTLKGFIGRDIPVKCDDWGLHHDEDYKIRGLQEYKNLIKHRNLAKTDFEQETEFNIGKVLNIIDPYGHTVMDDVDAAVYSTDARMDGPRRDVYFCHEKRNYGYDYESETLLFFEGKFPRGHLHSVTYPGNIRVDWKKENETTIPAHWSCCDADEYFNLRLEGMPVSERVFDSYLKGHELETKKLQSLFDKEETDSYIRKWHKKEFSNFLKMVTKQVLKNRKKGMSREESLDAALTLIDAQNSIRYRLNADIYISDIVKSGIAKTKESGYKHISESSRISEQNLQLSIKKKKDAKLL